MAYALAILVGALAGFINTLAGSGSLITLPMLMFLGLPATDANATNRVGVLLAAMVGARTFRKSGHLDTKQIGWLLVPSLIGSVIGAQLASTLEPQVMRHVITGVMVLMLVVIIAKPQRWLREQSDQNRNLAKLSTVLIFFGIGFYGGFIQAGVGILMLAALVLHERFTLVGANALKLILVLVFTAPALAIFMIADQVHWPLGLLMATGQCVGAYVAARFATGHPQANIWIRRLLILIVVASIIKLLADGAAT